MARHDHENLGEAVQTFFKTGTIVRLYEDSSGVKTGLCTVKVLGSLYCDIPLFYHCRGNSELLANGSLSGAAAAFQVGDQVIVQVLGHIEDKVPCDDEEICQPELEGLLTDSSGAKSSPPGGLSSLFDGVSSPLQVDCGEPSPLQLSCGENGSQGGLRASPGSPQASPDECTFDISNDVVKDLLGAGASSSSFSNLQLAPNSDTGEAGGSNSECITADYLNPDVECPDDCTPGEVLGTETLPNGTVIETICPEPAEGSGDCTADGSPLAIVGPSGDEMGVGDTFNFTSNAAAGSTFIWSTPDGGGSGDNISYTAPDSNSDCVANFTISLTCVSSDAEGNQSSETVTLFIAVKESANTNGAYRTGVTFVSSGLVTASWERDEFDCAGTFRSTPTGQVNAGSCIGDANCCQQLNPDVPNCGLGNASGLVCGAACCSNGSDQERWANCGVFADPTLYDVEDLRTSLMIDQGCCPNGLFTSATEPPY